jgi:hypothetical protein
VRRPARLCTPVVKNHEPGTDKEGKHLLCYPVNRSSGQPRHDKVLGTYVEDQFSDGQVDPLREDELCVPSMKTLPAF